MAASKYPVLSALLHDGKTYEPGKKIELEAEAAEDLLASGIIGPALPPKAETKPEDPKK